MQQQKNYKLIPELSLIQINKNCKVQVKDGSGRKYLLPVLYLIPDIAEHMETGMEGCIAHLYSEQTFIYSRVLIMSSEKKILMSFHIPWS